MFSRELYLDFLNNRNKRPLFSCMWEPLLNPSGEIMEQVQANGNSKLSGECKAGYITCRTVWKHKLLFEWRFPVALHASGGISGLKHMWMQNYGFNGQFGHPMMKKNIGDFLTLLLSGKWEEKLLLS